MNLIEDIEYLGTKIQALVEAEDLASQAQVKMLPELRKLYYSSSHRLRMLSARLLKRKPSLSGPRVPMEILERLFIVLRDQAEIALARASKLSGKESKRAMAEADRLAKLARMAAQSLKITAEVRGLWSDAYASEHGLGPWI